MPIAAVRNWVARRDALRRVVEPVWDCFFYKTASPNASKTHRNYHVVATNPLIVVTSEGVQDLELMSEVIGDRRASLIVLFWWSKETAARAREVRYFHRKHQGRFSHHVVTYLCNTPLENRFLQRLGLPTVYCNQNCLLDESRYRVVPGVEKEFDAIYNGRLEEGKRHYLLTEVARTALIAGWTPGDSAEKLACRESIRRMLPDAAVLNYPDARPLRICHDAQFSQHRPRRYLGPVEPARVGMILLREEGACYASAEYLLSGLPVVSTRSRGRDVFFDKEYVEIVRDEPKAVAEGVRRLIQRNVPAERIREATLAKMRPHKEKFVRLLQAVYDHEKVDFDVRSDWHLLYTDKMIRYARRWPVDFLSDIGGHPDV